MKDYMFNTTNIFTEYPDVVTSDELGKMLHIGKSKVYELLRNNEIKSFKLSDTGRTYYIPKINVIAYLNRKNFIN